MLSLKATIVILAVLCYNCEVYSDTTMDKKEYDFRGKQLMIGSYHIHKERIAYALCVWESLDQSAKCLITVNDNAFDESVLDRECDLSITTQHVKGRIELLGVDLFSEDKLFFRWLDVNLDNNEQAEIIIRIIDIQSCDVTTRKLLVDYNHGAHQTFFVALPNRFVVVYKNKDDCSEYFCKITVYPDGAGSFQTKWFRTAELVYTIDAFEDNSNMYFCSAQASGQTGYFFMDEAGPKPVITRAPNQPVAWSTANGIYLICEQYECNNYDLDGKKVKGTTLMFGAYKYAALYNSHVKGKYLAVICDGKPGSDYQLVRISKKGKKEFFFNLDRFPCSHNYKYMTVKIYQESGSKYCLSVFHSTYAAEGFFTFRKFCFSIHDHSV